jgi:hypothetical protein
LYLSKLFKPQGQLKHAIGLVAILFLYFSSAAQSNQARQGIIDLRQFDFQENRHVALAGEWKLYMSALIPAGSFENTIQQPGDFAPFPSAWNEFSKSLKPGKGYATYHLTILAKQGNYALEIPHFYSSYKMWLNSELIAANGEVGNTPELSKPQWLPQTVLLEAKTDTLHLVIHVSNFDHAKGGIRENILLGTRQDLKFKRTVAVNSNIVLFCTLIITSIVFIFVFLLKQGRSSLYFSALCFTWAVRSLFSNLYLATFYFPDFPWQVGVQIEYISLYLTMIWAILFLSSLFPEDVKSLVKYFFVGCNCFFVVFTLFTSAALFTQFLPVYLSFCLMLLVYIIYVIIHAVVYERNGVWLIVSCIMIGVVVFAYDLSAYQGLAALNPIIINIGYIGMFMLMATCLGFKFGFLKRSVNRDILTYDDLYGSGKK